MKKLKLSIFDSFFIINFKRKANLQKQKNLCKFANFEKQTKIVKIQKEWGVATLKIATKKHHNL